MLQVMVVRRFFASTLLMCISSSLYLLIFGTRPSLAELPIWCTASNQYCAFDKTFSFKACCPTGVEAGTNCLNCLPLHANYLSVFYYFALLSGLTMVESIDSEAPYCATHTWREHPWTEKFCETDSRAALIMRFPTKNTEGIDLDALSRACTVPAATPSTVKGSSSTSLRRSSSATRVLPSTSVSFFQPGYATSSSRTSSSPPASQKAPSPTSSLSTSPESISTSAYTSISASTPDTSSSPDSASPSASASATMKPSDSHGDSSLSKGQIIGIVIGALSLVATVLGTYYTRKSFYKNRKHPSRRSRNRYRIES